MSFDVPAEAYDRFMGVHSQQLAPQLIDFARLTPGDKVLDVGCGPGALTTKLAARLGAATVSAADPSEPFVAAARARHPGIDVQLAAAEALPYENGVFDAALAQLVVHLMADPAAGLREMVRVTRTDGVVAACVWDFAGERAPLSPFWRAVNELGVDVRDESALAGAREGHLAQLLGAAGLRRIENTTLVARVEYASFDEWWEPFGFGVGPAGVLFQKLDASQRERVRANCRDLLPPAPLEIVSVAWAARGIV